MLHLLYTHMCKHIQCHINIFPFLDKYFIGTNVHLDIDALWMFAIQERAKSVISLKIHVGLTNICTASAKTLDDQAAFHAWTRSMQLQE